MPDARFRLRVPNDRHRQSSEYARGDYASVAVCANRDGQIFARSRDCLIQARLESRRAAVYHKTLLFLKSPAFVINQHQPALINPSVISRGATKRVSQTSSPLM